jgi:hypothetical protein
MGIIYIARVDSKGYVGQTVQALSERIRKHYISVRKGSTTKFHNFLRKHSNEMEWIILEEVSNAQLNDAEIKWIAYYSNKIELCNHTLGGGGSLGKAVSNDTKQKISNKLKGRVVNTKDYTLISPSGELTQINNMRSFCRTHGYDQSNMIKLTRGKIKTAYGWRMK